MASLLEIVDLYCERDERVLFTQLNFTVNEGDLLQIEGPNGSGKTTLLKILAGLNRRYEGDLKWRGEHRDDVLFDYLLEVNYFGHLAGIKLTLSPLENLLWYAGLVDKPDIEQVERALTQVGLAGFEDMPCHYLSAGQKRRVAIARLLVKSHKVWILDEPFTAIDKKGVAMIESLILQHVKDQGAVIFTTHQEAKIDYPLTRINLGDYSG